MPPWDIEYTVGDVADIYATCIGDQPADQYARRLRHLIQQGVLTPRKRGEGRYARALFDENDIRYARLILAFADAAQPIEVLRAASSFRDNIAEEDKPAEGELHAVGFSYVLDRIEDKEVWYFNLYLSPIGKHAGAFARQPRPAPKGFTALVSLPVSELLAPLIENPPLDLPPPPRVPSA